MSFAGARLAKFLLDGCVPIYQVCGYLQDTSLIAVPSFSLFGTICSFIQRIVLKAPTTCQALFWPMNKRDKSLPSRTYICVCVSVCFYVCWGRGRGSGSGAGGCKGETGKQIRKHCKRNEENRIDLKMPGVGFTLDAAVREGLGSLRGAFLHKLKGRKQLTRAIIQFTLSCPKSFLHRPVSAFQDGTVKNLSFANHLLTLPQKKGTESL